MDRMHAVALYARYGDDNTVTTVYARDSHFLYHHNGTSTQRRKRSSRRRAENERRRSRLVDGEARTHLRAPVVSSRPASPTIKVDVDRLVSPCARPPLAVRISCSTLRAVVCPLVNTHRETNTVQFPRPFAFCIFVFRFDDQTGKKTREASLPVFPCHVRFVDRVVFMGRRVFTRQLRNRGDGARNFFRRAPSTCLSSFGFPFCFPISIVDRTLCARLNSGGFLGIRSRSEHVI